MESIQTRGESTRPNVSFEDYGGSAPENYERFFVPAIAGPLAEDLVRSAALRPGERVLDIACGTGVVARLAAKVVGPNGAVTGVDINTGMLAVAHSIGSGAANIEWRQGDAASLPLEDSTQDVALCQMGLQFIQDKHTALAEVRRVLVPGGRLLVNVPGPTPPLFSALEDALARSTSPQVAAFVRLVFALHEATEVHRLLDTAGFRGVYVTKTVKRLALPLPSAFLWQYITSTPLSAAVAALGNEGRAELERDIVTRWQPFADARGLTLELGVTTASGTT